MFILEGYLLAKNQNYCGGRGQCVLGDGCQSVYQVRSSEALRREGKDEEEGYDTAMIRGAVIAVVNMLQMRGEPEGPGKMASRQIEAFHCFRGGSPLEGKKGRIKRYALGDLTPRGEFRRLFLFQRSESAWTVWLLGPGVHQRNTNSRVSVYLCVCVCLYVSVNHLSLSLIYHLYLIHHLYIFYLSHLSSISFSVSSGSYHLSLSSIHPSTHLLRDRFNELAAVTEGSGWASLGSLGQGPQAGNAQAEALSSLQEVFLQGSLSSAHRAFPLIG